MWDDRARLEKSISFSCQEFLEITDDMATESKSQKLGQVIAYFKRDLKHLQALVTPSTPPEKFVECKSIIKDAVTRLEESEKEAKLIMGCNHTVLG